MGNALSSSTVHDSWIVIPVVHFNRKEVDVAFELPIIGRYEIESQELKSFFKMGV